MQMISIAMIGCTGDRPPPMTSDIHVSYIRFIASWFLLLSLFFPPNLKALITRTRSVSASIIALCGCSYALIETWMGKRDKTNKLFQHTYAEWSVWMFASTCNSQLMKVGKIGSPHVRPPSIWRYLSFFFCSIHFTWHSFISFVSHTQTTVLTDIDISACDSGLDTPPSTHRPSSYREPYYMMHSARDSTDTGVSSSRGTLISPKGSICTNNENVNAMR